MGIFNRIFNIGKSEVHSALDKLEDPIKMTEQGIRDLKTDLNKSLQGLAEIKALAIRAKNDNAKFSNDAKQYEQKAIMLLQKAQAGQLSPQEADRLAGEMLKMKENADAEAQRTAKEMVQHENAVATMEQNINKLKSKITTYENELRTLKARAKVSEATKKINKQLAQVDSSSTISMLERMKEKVAQDEALAESYGAIALESKSVNEEVEAVLGSTTSSDALLALKAKMGLLGSGETTTTNDDVPPPPAS
ncbi:PspA/IM30 family protein [Thermoflexibacter ruber]|uniref:Phage shock protein A (PspA) family protein n=1 Tax=Thermoflexibacter ruber TaxID=1003 RepID=A0A1I2CMU7_9BACT|nr:PspA/IM30 family protein [Thermoflexibacter ruber]SFE69554.1 phage shock protein A (PspA) family protein [Thermoflexibacter ruber]